MFSTAEPLPSVPESLNAYFERSQELLQVIADVLDVRTVFPRLSEIAKRILPHDALTLSSQDADLNIRLEAASTDDFHNMTVDSGGVPLAPELLIGDVVHTTRGRLSCT
jgi:hypothetical protein